MASPERWSDLVEQFVHSTYFSRHCGQYDVSGFQHWWDIFDNPSFGLEDRDGFGVDNSRDLFKIVSRRGIMESFFSELEDFSVSVVYRDLLDFVARDLGTVGIELPAERFQSERAKMRVWNWVARTVVKFNANEEFIAGWPGCTCPLSPTIFEDFVAVDLYVNGFLLRRMRGEDNVVVSHIFIVML